MVTNTSDIIAAGTNLKSDKGDVMSTAQFYIKYDGPALAGHEMDIKDLAPALLAFGELIEETNKILHGDKNEIRVKVQGGFKEGSFEVIISTVLSISEAITNFFSGNTATALANFTAVVGLVELIRKIRGKETKVEIVNNNVTVIILENGEKVETIDNVDLGVWRMHENKKVKDALEKTLKPLESEGVEFFAAGFDNDPQIHVDSSELKYFSYDIMPAEKVSDNIMPLVLLEIESAVFKEGNKWKFNDGSKSFFAEIQDKDFLMRIENGEERFGKKDILAVELKQVQTISGNTLKIEYYITEVKEHKRPLQQTIFE